MIKCTVVDFTTGETLPGADVYFSDATGTPGSATQGGATDTNGVITFSDKTPASQYITASFTGYEAQTLKATTDTLDFYLSPAPTTLPEVEITGQRPAVTVKPTTTTTTSKIVYWVIGGLVASAVALYVYSKKRK